MRIVMTCPEHRWTQEGGLVRLWSLLHAQTHTCRGGYWQLRSVSAIADLACSGKSARVCRLASMMKAPATAAARPPAPSAASGTGPAARSRSHHTITTAKMQKQPSGHVQPATDVCKSKPLSKCEDQTGHVTSIADKDARNDEDLKAASHQAATPSAKEGLEDEAVSPMCSPSPVRQLAFQLEHTALDDDPTPAKMSSSDVQQCRIQQRMTSVGKGGNSSNDAVPDGLEGEGCRADHARGPLLLVLGDEVQAMPWESLPGLQSER